MAEKTSHTIRIADARQSKQPNIFRMLVAWIVLPGALFWPGLVAGSAAMQWAGFVFFLILTAVFVGRFADEFKGDCILDKPKT